MKEAVPNNDKNNLEEAIDTLRESRERLKKLQDASRELRDKLRKIK